MSADFIQMSGHVNLTPMAKASQTIKAFQAFCDSSGEKPSEARVLVLKIVAGAKKPLGAYEILEQMAKTLNNPKPPTAYRAIEFLQKHGFVHRIESLNAYVSCHAGHNHKGSQFMICDSCGDVAEVHLCSMPESLKNQVAGKGFSPSFWNAEIHGVCASCAG